jgi:hypothetical protein
MLSSLTSSSDPILAYLTRTKVLGENPNSPTNLSLRDQIPSSPIVVALLSERGRNGCIPFHPYQKWRGAHWVLACLAEIGYPPGDTGLFPLRDQVFDWLFSRKHAKHIKVIDGRTRRCASQEGYAVFSQLALGIADERTGELARRLVSWQWPDGGWNCDKRPQASHSSFWESLIPMRALNLHGIKTGNPGSRDAAARAAEFFLEHRLFQRRKTGEVMNPEFLRLHYPWYWRYDVLAGLRAMAEIGCIRDPRCKSALDWLESRRLPDGGFPLDERFFRVSDTPVSGTSRVEWGQARKGKAHPYVTLEAEAVLQASGGLGV